jgi:Leucine-rich repeat (LRR) protein
LDISSNNIATIEGLNNLPIRELRLAHNKLQELTGLNELHNLSALDVSYNFITNLIPLQDCIQLCYLDVSHNLIPYIRNVEFLYEITWLQVLILCDNPCQQKDHYR